MMRPFRLLAAALVLGGLLAAGCLVDFPGPYELEGAGGPGGSSPSSSSTSSGTGGQAGAGGADAGPLPDGSPDAEGLDAGEGGVDHACIPADGAPTGTCCGNGICETGEGPVCPEDCPDECGNGICEKGETPATCPQDCQPDAG